MGKSIISILFRIFVMAVVPFIIGAAKWLYSGEEAKLISDVILSVIGSGCLLFLLEQERIADKELFDTDKKFGSCMLALLIGLLFAVLAPLLPAMGWPYPVLAVMIALYSNSLIGIVSNALLAALSVSLAGADYTLFLLYFISGTVAVILFRKLDEDFKIATPIFVSGMVLFLITIMEVVLHTTDRITMELFMIPFINLFITTILYLLFLKYYSARVTHKYRDKYMKITDPEYPLLTKLKSTSRENYYQMVHCAYLSDKIADKIGCDKVLAKAGAYYHKLSAFGTEKDAEAYQKMMQENEFPPELIQLLLAYHDKNMQEKENVIIYFSDLVVSSIQYLLKKDPEGEIDYNQMITMIFNKKMTSGILSQSKISMWELNQMKQLFMEENLYYDFLR